MLRVRECYRIGLLTTTVRYSEDIIETGGDIWRQWMDCQARCGCKPKVVYCYEKVDGSSR